MERFDSRAVFEAVEFLLVSLSLGAKAVLIII
jgi:hypothetical protein